MTNNIEIKFQIFEFLKYQKTRLGCYSDYGKNEKKSYLQRILIVSS